MSKNPMIVIVDDDASAREGTADLVRAVGFAAVAYPSAIDFLNSNDVHCASCLIADVQMPGMSGLQLHDRLVEAGKIIPTILVTGYPTEQDRSRALAAGAVCYLAKPFSPNDLLACVQSSVDPGTAGANSS